MTWPDGSWNRKVPCPSQVICISRLWHGPCDGSVHSLSPRFVEFPRSFVYCLPTVLLLQSGQGIGHQFVPARLAQQFAITLPAVRGEPPVGQRAGDGAARLAAVLAIAIPAGFGQRGDLVEGLRRRSPVRPRAGVRACRAYRSAPRLAAAGSVRDAWWCGGRGCRPRGPRRCAAAPRPACGSRWSICRLRRTRAAPPSGRRPERPRDRRAMPPRGRCRCTIGMPRATAAVSAVRPPDRRRDRLCSARSRARRRSPRRGSDIVPDGEH